MAFELSGISGLDFKFLNNFLSNGYSSQDLMEHQQQTHHPVVDIASYEWYFNCIRIGYSDWQYKKPVELKWKYDIQTDLVTFMGSLKGSVIVNNPYGQPQELLGNAQHNLFYSNGNETGEGVLKSQGPQASLFFIQFSKDVFLQLTQDANESLNLFAENVSNSRPTALSPVNLPMDAAMRNMVLNIVNCRYANGLKKMYLLSKSIEFLVLQAEACHAGLKPSYRYIKTSYDKECIHYAQQYILDHLESPPGLSDLSRIAGINEYKLKRGFKETFGTTVFGYLADARLEIAKNNLLDTKKTAGEIAIELGYSSVQHFSTAFKKKFGVSPGKMKK